MSTHHQIDLYPDPKDKAPLFINEPWLIDKSIVDMYPFPEGLDDKPDNVRIYVPMDLNREAILRRLRYLIITYGEANEENEINFGIDVDMLISQIEIYDRFWYILHSPKEGEPGYEKHHSAEGLALVAEFISLLEEIPAGCAEYFPIKLIDELRAEYLV